MPIQIAEWEIACCQPEAIVGHDWTAFPIFRPGLEPWWAEYCKGPIPDEVTELGTIMLNGALDADRGTITTRGITFRALITPGTKRPILGRFTGGGHGDFDFPVTGRVRRIRGIRYQRKNGYPIAQLPVVELRSTEERRNYDINFDEFLVDIIVPECETPHVP